MGRREVRFVRLFTDDLRVARAAFVLVFVFALNTRRFLAIRTHANGVDLGEEHPFFDFVQHNNNENNGNHDRSWVYYLLQAADLIFTSSAAR